MISALELANFKAFGEKTRIDFAPITLIYGQNSAGKSSILNALNLLKQTRMSREQGALLLPRAEGGLVDLGSFHELLYDHDSSRTLSFRLDFEASGPRPSRASFEGTSSRGFEVGFRRDQNENDIALAYINLYAGGSRTPAVRLEPQELGAEQAELMRRPFVMSARRREGRRYHAKARGAVCADVTTEPEFWRGEYSRCRAQRAELVDSLAALGAEFAGQGAARQTTLFGDQESSADVFDDALAFYQSDFSFEQYVERRRKACGRTVLALDGFMPVAAGPSAPEFPEVIATFPRRGRSSLRGLFFDVGELALESGAIAEAALESLFPLGPYRRAPQRLYIFTGTTPPDVGYSGNLLPDLLFRRRGLVEETNSWLDRLDIGYHITIAPVGTPSNDLFEVRLLDTKRSSGVSVALPDVGFGISQILPFVVQSLAAQRQTITIEQPEVHIHPRLQADMADLLIAGIQPDREHRFIVETHSEHLVLRLLRRIRETTNGELEPGQPSLRPEQVSIIYVERGATGSRLHRLRVNREGEFTDRWPHGFFEERARELF